MRRLLKGILVVVFFSALGLIAVAAIVLSVVEVSKDGYRAAPERPFVRIY